MFESRKRKKKCEKEVVLALFIILYIFSTKTKDFLTSHFLSPTKNAHFLLCRFPLNLFRLCGKFIFCV